MTANNKRRRKRRGWRAASLQTAGMFKRKYKMQPHNYLLSMKRLK